MQMVKGGNQTNFIGAQHAVPENVASHIADTHSGDFVLLNVNTPFAKMPLHRNPGAARGNAHAFVVIPLAATGSGGITEPVLVLPGYLVGNIWKGGGVFIGGDVLVVIFLIPT